MTGSNSSLERPAGLYDQDPSNYHSMMQTQLERENYSVVRNLIAQRCGQDPFSVLDICCGTGILAERLLELPQARILGIDSNPEFLKFARKRLGRFSRVRFLMADALEYTDKEQYDFVTLTSAYHHIHNEHKSDLLLKVSELLRDTGYLVIYEKAIPASTDDESYKAANRIFYERRIEWIQRRQDLTTQQIEALLNVCKLSSKAKDEFKVDYNYMMNDFSKCGFVVTSEITTWPDRDLFGNRQVGDFVFVLKKKR